MEDNEYMVFVEMDRDDALLNNLFELVDDILIQAESYNGK